MLRDNDEYRRIMKELGPPPLPPIDVLVMQAMRDDCIDRFKNNGYGLQQFMLRDDVSAVIMGTLTTDIADKLGLTTAQARSALNLLRSRGRVLKYTDGPGCTSRWWPKGLSEELESCSRGSR